MLREGCYDRAMVHSEAGDFTKFSELIRDIRIALLTTVDGEGRFHTRPVQTLEFEGNEVLWFFTDRGSPKADEVRRDVRVSLGYADPSKHTYVAVSGTGTVIQDAAKARELWTIEQRAYYPDGPQDSRLALLRVQIERAEYWIAPGRVSYLLAAARAALTGVPVAVIGANRKLD
jgi:general stress protein 26